MHTYPGGKCAWGNHYSAYGFYLEYLVGRKGGTQTLYSLQEVFAHNPTRVVKYKIIELRVRTTFEPLTEFGPSRQWRCSDDWRATDIPRYLPAWVLLVAFVAVAVAAPASAIESTIYPGVGIGKIKLGLTRAQVTHVLGPSSLLEERARVGGATYVQQGWNFDSWSVGFLRGRVVYVGTTLRRQRTAAGIGQGSSAEELVKAYPHGLCGLKHRLLYLVAHAGGTQTIFNLTYDFQTLPTGQTKRVTRVLEVWVRTRFRPLEEFASENRCESGWEKSVIVR